VKVDLDRVALRARTILLDPQRAWPRIVAERAPPDEVYRGYVVVLAAIPAVFGFVKGSLIGYGTLRGVSVRIGIIDGLGSMVLGYALTLIAVEVFARFIAFIAPYFGGRGERAAALRVVGYACTPAFVAGAAVILPGIGPLLYLGGVVYAFYLMFLAATPCLGIPESRGVAFIATAVAAGVLLGVVATRLATIFVGPLLPLGGFGFI
jgi:hypothetical protein